MRRVHSFDQEKDAERLHSAYYAESIASSVRDESEQFAVWVHDDEDLELAEQILALYLENPNDTRFDQAAQKATKKAKAKKKADKESRHKEVRAREVFKPKGLGPFTMLVIGVSVFIAFLTQLGGDTNASTPMLFVDPELWDAARNAVDWSSITIAGDEPTWFETMNIQLHIRAAWLWQTWKAGQVWRVLLPMVMHLGLMHILFNLWWWKDLAGSLERVHGTVWLVAFTLIAGIIGNLCEFFFGSPYFGGLSGVVYGLFGYVWMRGRFDPVFPMGLPKTTVMWMLAFYVLCFTDIIPVANWAHTGGLVVGMLWGFVSSGAIRRRFLRKDP